MKHELEQIDSSNAAKQDFMPLMRELVRAYQAFMSFDAELHRSAGRGLTVSQADVIFTLGNTQGMTCGEIGEKTLITKGTLTGVIDRLEKKNLVRRQKSHTDGRCTTIVLTDKGESVFAEVFPKHIQKLKARFDRMDESARHEAIARLRDIRSIFS